MLRNQRTGPHRPVRVLPAVAALAAAALSLGSASPAAAASAAATAATSASRSVDEFYRARDRAPLWFRGGQANEAVQQLLILIDSAALDGLDPSAYHDKALDKALKRAWGGNPGAVRKADQLLSRAFASYARDLRRNPAAGLQYLDPALKGEAPSPRALLEMAARAPSLSAFVRDMGWMNPNYAPLRRALVQGNYAAPGQRDRLRLNLARARVLPAAEPRYVIVNAAAQRLYMYEGGRLADSMKVVVGQQKDDRKTPMMAGYLRYASLNPYWNVPPDLVGDDVAIYVLKYGLNYLTSRGYEVLSDWSDNAVPIDPASVDWQAVMDGRIEIRVRQKPGPRNVLGKVKYTFTNPFGVYLHDTSAKELLSHQTRLYSGGCIRLEDAGRFGEWLFGRRLKASSDAPDIKVPLERPVPVYVTYLTAIPEGSSITFLEDVYGWDEKALAATTDTGGQIAAR